MTRDEAVAVALTSPDREVCGLVVNDEWLQISNVAKGNNVFIMDMAEVVKVLNEHGGNFTGIWHSHPDGDEEPSTADWQHHPLGTMYIITLPDGEVHEYAP